MLKLTLNVLLFGKVFSENTKPWTHTQRSIVEDLFQWRTFSVIEHFVAFTFVFRNKLGVNRTQMEFILIEYVNCMRNVTTLYAFVNTIDILSFLFAAFDVCLCVCVHNVLFFILHESIASFLNGDKFFPLNSPIAYARIEYIYCKAMIHSLFSRSSFLSHGQMINDIFIYS